MFHGQFTGKNIILLLAYSITKNYNYEYVLLDI